MYVFVLVLVLVVWWCGQTNALFPQEPILLKLKKEIEDRFEVEKWQKIADGIADTSGNKYPSAAVQKKYKELVKNGNGVVAMEE